MKSYDRQNSKEIRRPLPRAGVRAADWAKTDPEVRKAAEQKMQAEWRKWMGDHARLIALTEAGGKTKRRSVVASTIARRILISRLDDERAPCSAFEA
jgi:hypothetical protein